LFSVFVSASSFDDSSWRIECLPDVSLVKFKGFPSLCSFTYKGVSDVNVSLGLCYNFSVISMYDRVLTTYDFSNLSSVNISRVNASCTGYDDVSFYENLSRPYRFSFIPSSLNIFKWDTVVRLGGVNSVLDPVFNVSRYEVGTNRSIDYSWRSSNDSFNSIPNSDLNLSLSSSCIRFSNVSNLCNNFSIYGSNVSDAPHSLSSNPSSSVKRGELLYPLRDISVLSVDKSASCTASKFYVYDSNLFLLKSASFSGNSVSVNLNLSAFSLYYFVVDSDGATYSSAYDASLSFPAVYSNIVLVSGVNSLPTLSSSKYCLSTIISRNISNTPYYVNSSVTVSNPISLPATVHNVVARASGSGFLFNLSVDGANFSVLNVSSPVAINLSGSLLKYSLSLFDALSFITNLSLDFDSVSHSVYPSVINVSGYPGVFERGVLVNVSPDDVPIDFSVSCYFFNPNISCNVSPTYSFYDYGNVSFNISISSSVVDASYIGFLNISRFDGNLSSILLNVSVNNVFGVPILVNASDWFVSTYSDSSVSSSWQLYNNGSFNLSSCYVYLSGSLPTFSSSGLSGVVLEPNQSTNFSVMFSTPAVGIYSGYLDVYCAATVGNFSNHLSSKPYILLSSSERSGGGGGGGGSSSSIIVGGNTSLFKVYTSENSVSPEILISPSGFRILYFNVKSLSSKVLPISLKCEGSFCSNVVFSQNSLSLEGNSESIISVKVSAPDGAKYGDVFVFDSIFSSGGDSGKISTTVTVSRARDYIANYTDFSVTLWGLPKIIVYIVIAGLFGALFAGLRVDATINFVLVLIVFGVLGWIL